MNNKPLFLKFKAFIIFAITAIFFLFYMKPVPDDGIIPAETLKNIKVLFVKKGSEAYKKGIKPGYSIVGINHKLITSINEAGSLIAYPKSDFLFETEKGEVFEVSLKEKPVRRITQPGLVFIFISLLLYILSVTLILNNPDIVELYHLNTAIFITHFATLAFIVSPTFSATESFIVLFVFFSFPFVPFILADFLKKSTLKKDKKKMLFSAIPVFAIFYLFFIKNIVTTPILTAFSVLSAGYLYLAFIFRKKKTGMFFPGWFYHITLYIAIVNIIVLITIAKGNVIFGLIKLIVAQQILLNALILYNILKYGISNKKLALKKSFVDAFIFLILLIFYTFLIYFLNKVIGGNFISANLKIYSIMLGILIVFILNPINEWIKDKLEFLLFKQERKLVSKIFEMTDKMVSITESEEIEKYLEKIISDNLKLDIEVFCSFEGGFFKKINSHSIVEWQKIDTETNNISHTPFRNYQNRGYEIIYHFCEKEGLKIVVLAKEPLTIQQKKILEHIFIQFSLSYQNIKLIEKAQKQIELERDMKIAGLIQKSLIPSFHPEGNNFEVYGISESAKTVGGDFFDYLPSEEKKLKTVIGDVAGKSVPAAIMMVSAKETLFSRSANIESPSLLMKESNKLLFARSNTKMFVACIYFVFDSSTLRLRYINAGMPSPYLIRENSINILKKQKVRFPLGLLPEVDYEEEELKLRKGDVLVFMTDGVTESLEENIISVIEECTELSSAKEIAQCIIEAVKHKTGNILEDDATVIVLKIRE